jgi:hypothetical protein
VNKTERFRRSRGELAFARRRTLSVCLVCLGAGVALAASGTLVDPAQAAGPVGPVVVATAPTYEALSERQDELLLRLTPQMRQRLDAAGRNVFTRLAQPVPAGAPPKTMLDAARDVATSSVANLGSLGSGDIEEIVFVVLMQAAKSAEDDLRQIMAEAKALTAAKAKYRALMAAVQALQASLAGQVASDGGAASAGSAALGSRLQAARDRMAKSEAALSSVLLKKVADAQSSVLTHLR